MGFSGQGALQGAAMGAPIPFVGPAGGALLGGFFGGKDKVEGVPTPEMGSDSGSKYSDFMDSAFPGTTPWERLGANTPAGSVASSEGASKLQERLQARDLRNRTDVARGSNRASVIAAATPMGSQAVQSALASYDAGQGSDYDTHVKQGREGLPSQVRERGASAGAKEAETPYLKEKSRRAPDVVGAEISGHGGIISKDLAGIAQNAKDLLGSGYNFGHKQMTKYLSRAPRRSAV